MDIETIRRDLRAARRQADMAENISEQESIQQRILQLQNSRRRAQRRIDDVEDDVDAERRQLIQQLRDRCQQAQRRDALFTIRFLVT